MKKLFWTVVICSIVCVSRVSAEAPEGLRIGPGVPHPFEATFSGADHDGFVEAVQVVNGLNRAEAESVYFSRVAQKANEGPLAVSLVLEWAALLEIGISGEMREVSSLAQIHDLDDVEARLVFLARQTLNQPDQIAPAAQLLAKYRKQLVHRLIEIENSGPAH